MRVAIISDLHIGCPPVPGAFGHTPAAFVAYITELLDHHDHLVWNGDIFQSDHQLVPGRASRQAAIRRCLHAHPWLAELLSHPKSTLLRGNHDDDTRTVLGARDRFQADGPTGRLVVQHGDAYDPVIGTAPGISAAATWASGRLRRGGLGRLAQWLEGRDIAVKGARFGGPDGPYGQAAARVLAESDAQVVVFGHTHVPVLQAVAGGVLANPGSASLGRRAHVSVDLGEGWVEVAGVGRMSLEETTSR